MEELETRGDLDQATILTAAPERLRALLAKALTTEGAMDDEDTVVLTRTR